ncbi:MAG: hypothetical protein RW306_16425 [Geobacteraceae bacterium]|nr:hypothetical protein [Geobacteraceae bacterium]
MNTKPRMAKAHSKLVADEYIRLGWTLHSVDLVEGYDEPAEFFLVWEHSEDPVSIDWEVLTAGEEKANKNQKENC